MAVTWVLNGNGTGTGGDGSGLKTETQTIALVADTAFQLTATTGDIKNIHIVLGGEQIYPLIEEVSATVIDITHTAPGTATVTLITE